MKKTLAVLVLGALVVAACGDDDDAAADVPSVTDAWSRTTPAGSELGVLYLRVESPVDDQLTAITVPPEVAARVELHETVAADEASGDSMVDMTGDSMTGDSTTDDSMADMGGGAVTMQQVAAVDLPAGQTVAFEPGGYHAMLVQLAAPLEAGATYQATLVFANADPIVVDVEVRDDAP